MKIRQVGVEFHADRQTDMTKLVVAFCNFANVPKILTYYLLFDCKERGDVRGGDETSVGCQRFLIDRTNSNFSLNCGGGSLYERPVIC
jgi:hypothetical protein